MGIHLKFMPKILTSASRILWLSVATLLVVLAAGGVYYWFLSRPLLTTTVEISESPPAVEKKSEPVGRTYQATKPSPKLPAKVAAQTFKEPALVNLVLTEVTSTNILGTSVFDKKDSYNFIVNAETAIFLFQPPKIISATTYEPTVYQEQPLSALKNGQRVSVRFDKAVLPFRASLVEILDSL